MLNFANTCSVLLLILKMEKFQVNKCKYLYPGLWNGLGKQSKESLQDEGDALIVST